MPFYYGSRYLENAALRDVDLADSDDTFSMYQHKFHLIATVIHPSCFVCVESLYVCAYASVTYC